ncbi:MAG: fibronectin type III-like domain-contianing protein, partial [Clostridiales bacterium]|nr:fibronectin type III-like domain-contianing protein [Clostridiales bacterium]
KELKGFVKVSLAPKETKTVLIKLCSRDFTWYNEESGNWQLDGGEYRILAGASSADIRLEASVRVEPKNPPKTVFTQWSSIGEIVATPAGAEVLGQMFASSAKESSQSIDALGVSTFDLIKGMPLKKILAMGNTPDLDAAVENILKAVNGSV